MFSKIILAAALVSSAAATITFTVPSNISTSGVTTITWTSASTDPDTFSIELVNPSFNDAFALSNNVQTSDGTITLELPTVPVGGGYMLQAVNISNINDVFGETGDFSIASATTTSSSSTSASSTSTSGSLSASTTGSSSGVSTTKASSSGSTTATSTSSASSSTTSSFNAAAPIKFSLNFASVSAMLFGAFLGAAVLHV